MQQVKGGNSPLFLSVNIKKMLNYDIYQKNEFRPGYKLKSPRETPLCI